MSRRRRSTAGSFRLLLLAGAAISVVIGVWGVVWTSMLERVLGIEGIALSGGVARLYGGVMLAIGLAYALAAAQPQRTRSMLVVLLVVPLVTAMVTIAGVSRDEISGGKGIGFAVFELLYCLLYFRLYPRVEAEPAPSRSPDGPST
ncbi:MAG TPA: hypothetical protein VFA34_15870 [Actinomycetota bacterium]|nr:hypothetical protein [Actinomycetota bacterium]